MLRVLTFFALLSATALSQSRPNIIFILVDDLGYGDLGCFWQDQRSATKKFDTPALDTMAAEGAKLTHHYVAASVCAPSRASLLTGRHQGHCEVRDSQFDKALSANHGLASLLKSAGYRTIHIGKNGLAGTESSTNLTGTGSRNLAGHPLARGFDRFFGYLFHGDGHEHYPRNGTTNKTAFIYNDYQQVTNASLDLYTTDAWTAAAKMEIISEATDGDDQPFFLYLAYDAPHFNMQVPAVAYPALNQDGNPLTGGIQWTTGTDASGRVRFASTASGNSTSINTYYHPDIPSGWAASEKQHVGMIRRIDDSVADILQTLKDLGIDKNTLCVFTSDNGPHNEGNNPRTFQSFANMEGIKRDLWEAGIRTPAIVRWPGHIAGATGDPTNIRTISYPSGLWDWMPTFCQMAGIPAPAWCDGVSLLPTLTGSGTQRDKGYLYFEFYNNGTTPDWTEFPNHRGQTQGQMQAVRIGNHMGVRTGITTGSENFRIYNVITDPGQGTDLASSLPALQDRMKSLALTSRRPGAGVTRPYDGLALPAAPPAHSAPGVAWKSFVDSAGSWQWVPEFRDLTPTATGTTGVPNVSVRPAEDHFGLLFTGFIQIPTAGNYTFYLNSDTGADFFLHDGHWIDDDVDHTGSATSAAVNLSTGLHPFRLYYRHATGERTLALEWSGPGISRQPVPASAFSIEIPPPPAPILLWKTTFTGVDGTNRNLINTQGDTSLTDILSADDANLIFEDTTFSDSIFMHGGSMASGTYYSPRTNVDNPAATGQNGGWWQADFRYTGGSQKVVISSVVLEMLWSNSNGAIQTSATGIRDISLTAQYSLDGGVNWSNIAPPQIYDATEPPGQDQIQLRTFTPAEPISVDHSTQDLWLRVRAENANTTTGAYIDIKSIAFSGNVVPPETNDYTLWTDSYPGTDLTDPTADSDGDGLSNKEEHIWGLDPTTGSQPRPSPSRPSPQNGIFTYTRRNPALSKMAFRYEFSTALDAWHPLLPASVTASGTIPNESVSVTIPSNLLGPKLFVRVLAEPTPP